ncbi:hypothetical protein [Kaarinaea lacus]
MQVFDIATNQTTITLGTFPDGTKSIDEIYGFNNSVLAYVSFSEYTNIPPYTYYDVFALDFSRENSLTRITNTPDISERPIY